MKMEKPHATRADAALLRNTVLKLTAANRAVTIAVVVVVALLCWSLLGRIIAFGRGLDYSGLEALGPQVRHVVQQYNPFFWWAIAALVLLIIAYFLYGFAESMNRRARARRVSAELIGSLANQLSPSAVQVLQWCWQDRREPITVGVLQRTRLQLQHGRAAQIALAERHAALLDSAATQTGRDDALPNA